MGFYRCSETLSMAQSPEKGNRLDRPDATPENEGAKRRFESDTQKLVRRHLEDEDHEITEEEIASVRVGMTPPILDEATEARFEDEDAKEETERKYLGDDADEGDVPAKDERITPWDTIDPK